MLLYQRGEPLGMRTHHLEGDVEDGGPHDAAFYGTLLPMSVSFKAISRYPEKVLKFEGLRRGEVFRGHWHADEEFLDMSREEDRAGGSFVMASSIVPLEAHIDVPLGGDLQVIVEQLDATYNARKRNESRAKGHPITI
jgi:hypothetical protein